MADRATPGQAPRSGRSGVMALTAGVASRVRRCHPRNWDQNRVPAPGDELVFPATAQQRASLNDLGLNTHFNRIALGGNGYNIFGQPIALDAGIVAHNLTGSNLLQLGITLTTSE